MIFDQENHAERRFSMDWRLRRHRRNIESVEFLAIMRDVRNSTLSFVVDIIS